LNRSKFNMRLSFFKILLVSLIELPLIIGFFTLKFEHQISILIPEPLEGIFFLGVYLLCSILLAPFRLILPHLFTSADNGMILPDSYSGWLIPIIFYGVGLYLLQKRKGIVK
jgi:hypothetical protein